MNNRFSQKITIFHGLSLPEEGMKAGNGLSTNAYLLVHYIPDSVVQYKPKSIVHYIPEYSNNNRIFYPEKM
jgi:hypothetical protein